MKNSFTLLLFFVFLNCIASIQPINLKNPKTTADTNWVDAINFRILGKGWTNTEKPFHRLPIYAESIVSDNVWRINKQSAGISILLSTSSDFLSIKWKLSLPYLSLYHMPATSVSGLDIYYFDDSRWLYLATTKPLGTSNYFSIDLDHNIKSRPILINLPLYNGLDSLLIGTNSLSTFSNESDLFNRLKPIVFYGTSIVQGGCVSRPGLSQSGLIQRWLNIETINLGFSGSAKMEIELAELISEIDASLYVIDCMWNQNDSILSTNTELFLESLLKTRPNTPVLLVEQSDFKNSFPTTRTTILRNIYNNFIKRGFSKLFYLEGINLIGNDTEGTVDGVHLNDLGMFRQSEIILTKIREILTLEH